MTEWLDRVAGGFAVAAVVADFAIVVVAIVGVAYLSSKRG